MDLNLGPEHELLRSTVRRFAETEIAPVAAELDAREEFSEELTRAMGGLGLFGIVVPEDYGGQGMDYLAYVIAVEEVARVDGSQAATVAAHNSLGIGPLYYFGNETQKRTYLPTLCTGEALWSFGLTEPDAGSDSRGTRTTAVRDCDEWVINGSKIFITNGSSAISAGVTVQTVTDRSGEHPEFTTFIVEAGTPGFTAAAMHGKLMWRGSDTAEMYFDDVRVPHENMLGDLGEGSHQMLATLDSGRLGIAAMGLGAAQGAFEQALEYAKTRRQFGRPIGEFQAIAFKLADMATKIEHARAFLYRAAWLRDSGKRVTAEAAMAKLYCSEVAKEVADEAVQIHGGYGLMKDYPVERFYRDQRLLQIGEGTSEIQRLVISRSLGL
jgi:alkylation response protein AidB-like acyl-CoA dehydrogenase